jgi:hypothetical protein
MAMPIQTGVGVSTEKDPLLAVREAVRAASLNIRSEKIDLAILFSTPEFASTLTLKTISSILGENTPIIGCSGFAVISPAGIIRRGIAILLLELPAGVYLHSACVKESKAESGISLGEILGKKLLSGSKGMVRDLGIIFPGANLQEDPSLIYGLQEILGKSFPLISASASDIMKSQKTCLYFNQEMFTDGANGLLFGGKLDFGLGIRHGWHPLGKPRYITRCSANTVHEIDRQPAANIYKEYFACDLAELRKKLKYISLLYPIGVFLNEEEEYLLRSLRQIKDDGALVFQGNIPQNSLIRLMIGSKESCLNATKRAAEEARKNKNVNFVLVFNAVSRYIFLRRDAHKEIEILKENLPKDTPIIGLYTYGEEAPLRAISYHGQTYFHNQTVTVLAVAAKEKIIN